MLTARIQTSEASKTTFKDEALEVAVILDWMKRACVKIWKVYDNECAGNLILILGLEMENIWL
jgi:hypothetical protein